jgi:hypothetical protein
MLIGEGRLPRLPQLIISVENSFHEETTMATTQPSQNVEKSRTSILFWLFIVINVIFALFIVYKFING